VEVAFQLYFKDYADIASKARTWICYIYQILQDKQWDQSWRQRL